MTKLLKIRQIESLVLSKSPIPSPDSIGIHNVLAVPLPSTIVGMLGNLLGVTQINDGMFGFEALLKGLKSKGCSEPVIKGPILVEGEEKTYITVGNKLVMPSDIKDFSITKTEKISVDYRLGVRLRRGYDSQEKVTYPGYMYRINTVDYGSKELVYLVNCNLENKQYLARVGGEDRIAIVKIEDSKEEKLVIKSPKEIENEGYYIALSPIPLIPKKDELWLSESTEGMQFIKEIIGIPQEEDKEPKKKVERLFLGYSEALKLRRPQILSLPAGTIVKVKKIEGKVNNLIETLWSLGYASLLSIP